MINTKEKFYSLIIYPGDIGECFIWSGSKNKSGYGQFCYLGRNRMAYRLAYTFQYGEFPNELQIDHLCVNKICVNPMHLEPVTMLVNIYRSDCASAINKRKTHCLRGHEFTERNTYKSQGKRKCKTCYLGHD